MSSVGVLILERSDADKAKGGVMSAVVICGMCVVSFTTATGTGTGIFTADSTGSFATCTCGIRTWATGSLMRDVFSWTVIAEGRD